MTTQVYTCYVVKKYRNTTINVGFTLKKTWSQFTEVGGGKVVAFGLL